MSDLPRAGAQRGAPLFYVRNLRVDFGARHALSIDSLDVEEGGITVLTGENGSGKTTLLRVLNGLLAPSGGSVLFRGEPLDVAAGRGGAARGSSLLRSDCVLVHQSPLMLRGSVYQNVAYGLRIRGVPHGEILRRVSESLSRVGMGGCGHRRASSLSGGEKQRIAIARALALRPRVLLLDEPTANIDPEFRRTIEAIVRSTVSDGTTLIICSHDMEFAYRLCDRLIPLEAGRRGVCRENILRGRVIRTDEQFTHFRAGDGDLLCPAREGDFLVAVLPLDDVLLSREPLDSSARNRFLGTVTSVQEEQGLLRVTLACGFTVQTLVTFAAGEELAIEMGRRYYVTFKASAVRLY
jgi:tungstate transport system ATP-binding protein